ncbi:hypothetical protein [Actinomadura sp. 7K534]|uniref:hypothetical protein n=1 Tax=Actinomadura sp. 7K534 TaxID=2530366 RepID=UPI0014046AC3|nr:hypothetical protein [Actinomadura sp. 7K534]
MALTDPCGDRLDRLAGRQAIGDLGRSSWLKYRLLIGFSIIDTLPASMNQFAPQLNETPTLSDAFEPDSPCRISSK